MMPRSFEIILEDTSMIPYARTTSRRTTLTFLYTIPLEVELEATDPTRSYDRSSWLDYAIQREDQTFCSVHMSAAVMDAGGAIGACIARSIVGFLRNAKSHVPTSPTDFKKVAEGDQVQ